MISYFENGVKQTRPNKEIDIYELVEIIRHNPKIDLINEIRRLKLNGNDSYQSIKKSLPNITPNCLVSKRNVSTDINSFNSFSQFIYFDLDNSDNVNECKNQIIEKYGQYLTMVCISSSGAGLSIIFKIENEITVDNFNSIWLWIRNEILINETVDVKTKDIGRCMFISSDPEVYFNDANQITIDESELEQYMGEGCAHQYKSDRGINIILDCALESRNIYEAIKLLKIQTPVDIIKPVVEYKIITDYVKIYIPKVIKDGNKHSTYTSIIHHLYYLNPAIDPQYIYWFLKYINDRVAKPKMNECELERLFQFVYQQIINANNNFVETKTKKIHFNENCKIQIEDKIKIASKLNGIINKNKSIQKIIDAKDELRMKNLEINKLSVTRQSGMSRNTVIRHFDKELIDIQPIIDELNIKYANQKSDTEDKNPQKTLLDKIFENDFYDDIAS